MPRRDLSRGPYVMAIYIALLCMSTGRVTLDGDRQPVAIAQTAFEEPEASSPCRKHPNTCRRHGSISNQCAHGCPGGTNHADFELERFGEIARRCPIIRPLQVRPS